MARCANPVLIGGCPRSGTTALWNALRSHPHLGPAPDKWQDKELWFFSEFFEGRSPQNVARRTNDFDRVYVHEAVDFINDFMTRYQASVTGRYLTAYVDSILYAREILDHIPAARFLFVIRHPQENVWSLLNAFFAAGHIRKNRAVELIREEEVVKATQIWRRAAKIVIAALDGEFGDSVKVVRQEQMVLRPVEAMREVLEFVGEPFLPIVPDTLAGGAINSSFAPDREGSETSFLHVVPFEDAARRTRYFEQIRRELAAHPDICATVKALAHEEMQVLGYADYAGQFITPEIHGPRRQVQRAVEISGVAVLGERGLGQDTFAPGEAIRLRVSLRANENARHLSVSFFVRDEEQNRLFGTTTFDEFVQLPDLAAREELQVTFRFLQVLRVGKYWVTVSVNSVSDRGYADNQLHHELTDACEFEAVVALNRPIHYKFDNPTLVEIESVQGPVVQQAESAPAELPGPVAPLAVEPAAMNDTFIQPPEASPPDRSPDTRPANYRYWQEQGGSWSNEYDQRKKRTLYYHLQESMLADYLLHSAPACVLEYGCGVGRHLKYLRHIPQLEVYGFDQSPTMLGSLAQWAEPAWTTQHITLGEPGGRLPYPDNFFDVVYTAEVLIHIRPEDLPRVLSELRRVARWQILHWETAPDYPLVSNEHDGCWYHNLIEVYAQLGYPCEVLTAGYQAQVPYRVVLDPQRPVYTPSPVIAQLYHRMEEDLQPALFSAAEWRETIEQQERRIIELQQQGERALAEFRATAADLQHGWDQERLTSSALNVQVRQQRAELAALTTQLEIEQRRAAEYALFLEQIRAALKTQAH